MMGKKKGDKKKVSRQGKGEGKYNENGKGNRQTGKGPGFRGSKSSCGSIMTKRGHQRQF